MRLYAVALLGSIVLLAAGPAGAQSLNAWNAARAACRDFAADRGPLAERGVPAEDIAVQSDTRVAANQLRTTLTVETPRLSARGFCILVGAGTNWSVIELTVTRLADR